MRLEGRSSGHLLIPCHIIYSTVELQQAVKLFRNIIFQSNIYWVSRLPLGCVIKKQPEGKQIPVDVCCCVTNTTQTIAIKL